MFQEIYLYENISQQLDSLCHWTTFEARQLQCCEPFCIIPVGTISLLLSFPTGVQEVGITELLWMPELVILNLAYKYTILPKVVNKINP